MGGAAIRSSELPQIRQSRPDYGLVPSHFQYERLETLFKLFLPRSAAAGGFAAQGGLARRGTPLKIKHSCP